MKPLKNHLNELVSQNVIDEPTAIRISKYYDKQQHNTSNRILMAFGVLAAFLIGLGIILIIGHNWDILGRGLKTILAFLPLLIAQGLCYYAIKYKTNSAVWRESCSVLLFFGLGACMAMVSQIYNLQGSLSQFLLTWMALSLPIIYLLPSKAAAIFYFIGVSSAMPEMNHSEALWLLEFSAFPWMYLLMFGLGLPFYIHHLKNKGSNFTHIMNWVVALSFLSLIMKNEIMNGDTITLAFILLMGVYLGIGRLPIFKNQKLRANSFVIIGSLGTFFILYISSFDDFWQGDFEQLYLLKIILLTISALALLIWNLAKANISPRAILPYVFLIYYFIFSTTNYFGVAMINLLLLGIGLEYIWRGHKVNRISFFNYGLSIISITAISRFLEWDLDFLFRGLCFISLGLLFFVANYFLIKRKNDAKRVN